MNDREREMLLLLADCCAELMNDKGFGYTAGDIRRLMKMVQMESSALKDAGLHSKVQP